MLASNVTLDWSAWTYQEAVALTRVVDGDSLDAVEQLLVVVLDLVLEAFWGNGRFWRIHSAVGAGHRRERRAVPVIHWLRHSSIVLIIVSIKSLLNIGSHRNTHNKLVVLGHVMRRGQRIHVLEGRGAAVAVQDVWHAVVGGRGGGEG